MTTENQAGTIELTQEDYQGMLLEKQRELNECIEEKAKLREANAKLIEEKAKLREANAKLIEEKTKMAARAMKVHDENRLMKASPELAAQMAEMEFHLNMTKQFTSSGAFPKVTPEQAYTLMKAGAEMGMKPVEALNSLYIVNGQINPHGKGMPGRIKQFGYNIEYLNETSKGCDVRVWNGDGFDVTEHVSVDDPILKQNSKFMKIHPRYKMRYHGLRAIINFHLPHIYGSTSDMFAAPVQQILLEQGNGFNISQVEDSKERARIERHIEKSTTLEQLAMVQQYVGQYQLTEEYQMKFTELSDQNTATHEEE